MSGRGGKDRRGSPPAPGVRKSDVKRVADVKRSVTLRTPVLPRRVYHAREQMLSAFWAGMGHTGEEIAEKLGGTTGERVRAMLRKCGIHMRRKPRTDEIVTVRCRTHDRRKLFTAAANLGVDPGELALLAIRRALDDPALLVALAEEIADDA